MAFQAANDYPAARQAYTEFLVRSPEKATFVCASPRSTTLAEWNSLFADAEADYEAVRYMPAVEKYEQLQAVSASYRRDLVAIRLFELYMLLGTGLIDQRPAMPADVPQALDYFDEALSLRARAIPARGEDQRLAKLYLGGTSVLQGDRDEGIAQLQPLYDQQPNYLGGVLRPYSTRHTCAAAICTGRPRYISPTTSIRKLRASRSRTPRLPRAYVRGSALADAHRHRHGDADDHAHSYIDALSDANAGWPNANAQASAGLSRQNRVLLGEPGPDRLLRHGS